MPVAVAGKTAGAEDGLAGISSGRSLREDTGADEKNDGRFCWLWFWFTTSMIPFAAADGGGGVRFSDAWV